MAVEWICQSCGANWSQDNFTEGCDECGGGAMSRPCVFCGGECGNSWDRAPMDSQDFHQAHWIGSCGLSKEELAELFRRQAEDKASS